MKYRHLGRKSSHRQALLRNLVTSLFTHESITTTWPKAKEAQRLAEKLITLGKKNTEASRRRALSIFFVGDLFGPNQGFEISGQSLSQSGPAADSDFGIGVFKDLFLTITRRPTSFSQNSSGPFESVTQTGQADTPVYYALSQKRMTRHHQQSWN